MVRNLNRLHEYDLLTIKTRQFQTEESLLPTECKLLCRLFCRVRLHTAALVLSIVSHVVGDRIIMSVLITNVFMKKQKGIEKSRS